MGEEPSDIIGTGQSRAFQFAPGKKTTISLKGTPAPLRLRIVTRGGTIIDAPLSPHASVEIFGGSDGADLDISLTIEASETGPRSVG